ncbi:MAG: Zn-dependent hydrolase, partial [Bacteroidetes bacterium]
MNKIPHILMACLLLLAACQQDAPTGSTEEPVEVVPPRPEIYKTVQLTTDLSQLSESERQMLPLLIEAAQIMDGLFWKEALPDEVKVDPASLDGPTARYYQINYGPWDRLNGNKPFIEGVGPKPAGANFYPTDMSKEEFEAFDDPAKDDLYTLLRRDAQGNLMTVPYHEAFAAEVQAASDLLMQAAELADDPGLKHYLSLRAEALLSDEYDASDMAWLDMKNNGIDCIIGPIETYEDQLYGYKAAHEAYVLVKDKQWSQRLARYVAFLPELQRGLPVDEAYKAEEPGTDAELNAYDAVYYAGDCNAGSKTIAVNLPNDEEIQKSKGTRRSQLKNAMRAKFDHILLPIADVLIAEDQRKHITFEAFFANTMFHEVAHGLGIKTTINGKGTVRQALKEQASALEEGKADILGLYMVTQLFDKGEIQEGELEDYYVTFLA